MAISVVSFSLSWTTQPEAWGPTQLGAGFLYHNLSPTGLVSKTNWLPVFTELYNTSVAHSISLEWHVWSSSSRNNCHAVHRSLSFGASVWLYHGILPCPILSAKPAYVNGICNLRVFGMACWLGRRSIYNNQISENRGLALREKNTQLKGEGNRLGTLKAIEDSPYNQNVLCSNQNPL